MPPHERALPAALANRERGLLPCSLPYQCGHTRAPATALLDGCHNRALTQGCLALWGLLVASCDWGALLEVSADRDVLLAEVLLPCTPAA